MAKKKLAKRPDIKSIIPDELPNRAAVVEINHKEWEADQTEAIAKGFTKNLLDSENISHRLMCQLGKSSGMSDSVDHPTMTKMLKDMCEAVKNGDMSDMEKILVTNAKTLEFLSAHLISRAMRREYLDQFESDMKLGLRAQNQMRHTIETLGKLKNPPVVIAKQANVATNQQINNEITRDEKVVSPNQLSGSK